MLSGEVDTSNNVVVEVEMAKIREFPAMITSFIGVGVPPVSGGHELMA
jgi:hypothetical protein